MKVFAQLLLLTTSCLALETHFKTKYLHKTNQNFAPGPRTRIVGGAEVEPHSIPWQVSLQLSNFGNAHYCGASVIDSTTLLTAAHCCDGVLPEELLISAGDHNLFVDEGTEQAMGVAQLVIHEDYDPLTVVNDICILKVDGQLEMNDNVQSLPLPDPMQTYAPGTQATLSGWGYLAVDGPAPDVLYSTTVAIVSDEECKDAYGAENISDSMICAGGGAQDSCQGDSGGPMTCEDGRICGIVSWGFGCGVGYPGVNTEVSYFVDWIVSHV